MTQHLHNGPNLGTVSGRSVRQSLTRRYVIEPGNVPDDLMAVLRTERVHPVVSLWCKQCGNRGWRLAQVFQTEKTKTLIWMTYSEKKLRGRRRVIGHPSYLREPSDQRSEGWIFCPRHRSRVSLHWSDVQAAVTSATVAEVTKVFSVAV